jgi:hypothetical protein
LVKFQDKNENKLLEEKTEESKFLEIDDDDKNLNFTISEIELLLDMLNINKCDNYTDWINVHFFIEK